jgi:ferredoxin
MQTKKIPLDNQRKLRDLLFSNLNHPRWEEVAERCLSCGNCTSVCPTCFCHSAIEKPSLDGTSSEHQREWDSCFTAGHSYLSGKVIRDDTRKRYRQWLTHKVGSWFDQFDTSGCVGCGRCVTWCPVGIDITEELAAISGEPNMRITERD